MDPFIKQELETLAKAIVVMGVAVIGITALIVPRLRLKSEKDAFLLKISLLRERIDKSNVAQFYVRTLPEVKEAVFALRPFLGNAEAAKLDGIWTRYSNLCPDTRENQITDDEWTRHAEKDFFETHWTKLTFPPLPSDYMLKFLQAFEDVARSVRI